MRHVVWRVAWCGASRAFWREAGGWTRPCSAALPVCGSRLAAVAVGSTAPARRGRGGPAGHCGGGLPPWRRLGTAGARPRSPSSLRCSSSAAAKGGDAPSVGARRPRQHHRRRVRQQRLDPQRPAAAAPSPRRRQRHSSGRPAGGGGGRPRPPPPQEPLPLRPVRYCTGERAVVAHAELVRPLRAGVAAAPQRRTCCTSSSSTWRWLASLSPCTLSTLPSGTAPGGAALGPLGALGAH